MRTIAISNQKGGCGKTTTAINLSAGICVKRRKVLLIDFDPQAHTTMGFGIAKPNSDRCIYNVLTNAPDKRKSLPEVIINIKENLDLVPSHIILSAIEQELKDREDGVSILFKTISTAPLEEYDYIIIDCPPSLGFLTFNAIRAADEIIIPLETSTFSLMGVGKLISMIELTKVKLHHAPDVMGLVTMFDSSWDFSQRMLDKIKGLFKNKIFNAVISRDVAIKESQERAFDVFDYKPDSRVAADYLSLTDEILMRDRGRTAESFYQEVQKILYESMLLKDRVFKLQSPDAKEVHIAGDFNSWNPDESYKMAKNADGIWEIILQLKPGHYRYKFIIDGLWHQDPENRQKEPDPYGSYDSAFDID